MLRPIGGFCCCRTCDRGFGRRKRRPKPNRVKDQRERERSERHAY